MAGKPVGPSLYFNFNEINSESSKNKTKVRLLNDLHAYIACDGTFQSSDGKQYLRILGDN
jgi:hypothetical protein